MNQRRPGVTLRSPLKNENMTDKDIYQELRALGLSDEAAKCAMLLEPFSEVCDEGDERTMIVHELITTVIKTFGYDGTGKFPSILKGTKVWEIIRHETRSSMDLEKTVEDIIKRFKTLSAREYCRLVSDPLMMTLEDVLKDRSIKLPVEVFGHFIHKGNIAVLFGETNSGKSLLAYEIGQHYISSNPTLENEQLGCNGTSDMRMVVYYDLEMSLSQVRNRYGASDVGGFKGMDSFVLPDTSSIQTADQLLNDLRARVNRNYETLCIIDNLTMLEGLTNAVKIRSTITRMKCFLMDFPDATILMISHTKKRKNFSPIETGDMKGSKDLANLVDSVLALGNSKMDKDIKYVKHIKSRDSKKYDYVARFDLTEEDGRVQFQFISWDEESFHVVFPKSLRLLPPTFCSTETKTMVMALVDNNYTIPQIAKEMKLSVNRIKEIITNNIAII